MKTTLALAVAVSIAAASSANALPISGPNGSGTLTASSANGATASPFTLRSFGTSTANGLQSTATIVAAGSTITFTPDSTSPMAGLYAGSVSGIVLSPFSGTSLPGGTTNEYLAAQPSDPVTISYTTSRTLFNLLWGSVDTFNSLDLRFFNGTTLVSDLRVTGSQVLSLDGGALGSAFVSVTDNAAFSSVVLTSTGSAFEFVPGVVPEPLSIALLGTGLLGMGLVISRRRGNTL